MPSRTDWLLRFIMGAPPHFDGAIDRVRLMKGFFLFQTEGRAPADVNYKFRPYDYGPFAPEIYSDIHQLKEAGFISESRSGRDYRATELGRAHAATIAFAGAELSSLLDLRAEVSDLSFRDLLRRVYRSHPESAERSIARDVLE